MAIRVGDNILPNIKGNLDARYGPYDSILEALEKVFDPDSENRDRGITVGIRFGNTIKEYWFDGGIEDSNFVEKKPSDYIKITEKGIANGVAPLNAQRLISSEFLPSYVDDVIEVYATFTKTSSGILENIQLYSDELKTESIVGESGKIYIDLLTNYQFRWSGTVFVPISIPDSYIIDLGQFDASATDNDIDNVMLRGENPIIFNNQCLIITYTIGLHRAVIINQYNTGNNSLYKYFNGRKFFRDIGHTDTTITNVQSWQLDNVTNLKYNSSTHVIYNQNRYYEMIGDSAELPVANNTTDGLMSKEDKQDLVDNTEKLLSIWNGNPELANISLTGTWTIYNQDNSIFSTQTSNPIVEFGYKAKYTGTWKWIPVTSGKSPTSTSGNWGTTLIASNTNSSTFTSADYVTSNTTYKQLIFANKLGLMVSGSNVIPASGLDSKQASTSITFNHRLYYGSVDSNVLSESMIKALSNELVSSRVKEIKNVTTAGDLYYCFAYPVSLGKLSKITLDGATPVLTAFTLLENITITNAAGLQVAMYVYISNNKGAFTNNILKFE